MHSATLKASAERQGIARIRDIPNWAWWLLALSYVGVRSWYVGGVGVYGFFGDPDDATRLIQVRELMASWHWFDTTTMKVGGDAGMLSHWSRLVDLPLATLIATFNLVMPLDDAERLTHIVWPLSLLGALMWVLFRATAKVGGETAGRLSILFVALTPLAWYQFAVGRIDHHNVMIAATVSAALLMWAYPCRIEVWRVAGLLLGLALAVGYEALAPAVALSTFVAAWALFDRQAEKSAAAFAIALALTFTAAFFATIPPSRWMDIRCDAISLNMVALIGSGVTGFLVALGPGKGWPLAARIGAIAACGAIGIAIYGMLEPKCLAGPKGQLPPLVLEIWLNKVAENASFVDDLVHRKLEQSFGLLIFFSIAIAAQVYRLRDRWRAADLFLLASLVTFIGLACWQYKFMSYASFLSLAPVAIVFSGLGSIGEISAATVKLGAIVLLNQSTLAWMSGGVNALLGAPNVETAEAIEDARACSKPENIHDLAGLSPGIIASHIDVGAFIAVNTPLRALAAPYHRIANAIIANHEIFSAHDARTAAGLLKQQDVDYVAICDGLDKPMLKDPEWKGTLKADLINGKAPSFLTPATLSNPHSIYHVWKVDRAALNLQLSKAAASAP
ncbi:MAG: hypothetical protein QM780_15680 [Hyphomicrobium sp.]|uniref:hypothetical protein n=1 Tax=Hyphomicrobium sp. TaxID=82 RepID=UPI0039E3013C